MFFSRLHFYFLVLRFSLSYFQVHVSRSNVMSLNIEKAVESLAMELNKVLQRATELKKSINQLLALAGKPPMFTDVEYSPVGGPTTIRRDQFFGMTVTMAAREYLRMRGSAATPQEILDALVQGGFEFPKEWRETFFLKNLAISLKKNVPRDFVYLKSSNSYGLWDFYPDKKREKERKAVPGEMEGEQEQGNGVADTNVGGENKESEVSTQ